MSEEKSVQAMKQIKITYCQPGDSTHGGGFSAVRKKMKREAEKKRTGSKPSSPRNKNRGPINIRKASS